MSGSVTVRNTRRPPAPKVSGDGQREPDCGLRVRIRECRDVEVDAFLQGFGEHQQDRQDDKQGEKTPARGQAIRALPWSWA